MKVAVVGAGAMGCLFATSLALTPETDVVLVDVADGAVNAVNASGVTVTTGRESQTTAIRAVRDTSNEQPADIVILAVKGYHTDAAIRGGRGLIDGGTIIVSLQNGWGNADILCRHVSPRRIVVGVCYHSVTLAQPARIDHTGMGDTFVGSYAGQSVGLARKVADQFSGTTIAPIVVTDPLTEMWKKLVLNSATLPVAAITRLTAGVIASDEALASLVDSIACETASVGAAAGLDIDREERLEAVHSVMRGTVNAKASMLQDVEAGRPTEVDFINGAVVDMAARHNIDAPLNQAMYALIAGYERSVGTR